MNYRDLSEIKKSRVFCCNVTADSFLLSFTLFFLHFLDKNLGIGAGSRGASTECKLSVIFRKAFLQLSTSKSGGWRACIELGGSWGGISIEKKSCCSSEKQARRRENQVFKRDIQDEK